MNPRQHIRTKGDNNLFNDVLLYPRGREYFSRDEIVGFVNGYVPFLGWIVIGIREVYWVKFAIIVAFIGLVLIGGNSQHISAKSLDSSRSRQF